MTRETEVVRAQGSRDAAGARTSFCKRVITKTTLSNAPCPAIRKPFNCFKGAVRLSPAAQHTRLPRHRCGRRFRARAQDLSRAGPAAEASRERTPAQTHSQQFTPLLCAQADSRAQLPTSAPVSCLPRHLAGH
eukprot:6205096-Pleurochrysis_carterae.AAC.1